MTWELVVAIYLEGKNIEDMIEKLVAGDNDDIMVMMTIPIMPGQW